MLVDAILGVNPSQDRAAFQLTTGEQAPASTNWPNHGLQVGNAQRCGDRQDAPVSRWRRGFSTGRCFLWNSRQDSISLSCCDGSIINGFGLELGIQRARRCLHDAPSPLRLERRFICPHDSMPPVCGPGRGGGGTGSPATGDILGPFSGYRLLSRRGWYMGHSQGGATRKLVICWVAEPGGAPMALSRRPKGFSREPTAARSSGG